MKNKVVFEYEQGSFFSGRVRYTITLANNRYLFESFFYNGFADMKPMSFEIAPEEIDELLKAIAPARKWKRKYNTPLDIYDGFGFTLISRLDSCRVNSEGYERFPKDYNSVIEALQEAIEGLCQKKDPDHFVLDESKRRKELK